MATSFSLRVLTTRMLQYIFCHIVQLNMAVQILLTVETFGNLNVMDQIQNCEEISSLFKLGDEYERQLKMVGIELSDLPDDCATLVDKYAEAKLKTHLHSLSSSFLDEYYCTKKKDYIEHKYNKSRIEMDIRMLENEIELEKKATQVLADFIQTSKSKLQSEEEMERQKFMIEKQIECLLSKQEKSFKPPSDFNMDELIAKVELLETKRKQSKQK